MAMDKLIASASKVGANAIVGIRMDIDEISGKSTQMFMISVSGTAVLIKSKYQLEVKDENSSIMSGRMIESQVKTRALIERLKKCNGNTEFKEITAELTEKDVIVPLELLIEIINGNKSEFTHYKLTDDFRSYLESYEKMHISNSLNNQVEKSEDFTSLFTETYTVFALPDYNKSMP